MEFLIYIGGPRHGQRDVLALDEELPDTGEEMFTLSPANPDAYVNYATTEIKISLSRWDLYTATREEGCAVMRHEREVSREEAERLALTKAKR